MNPSFGSMLDEAWRRTGQNKKDFARAIGVTPSALSRLLHTPEVAPDCETCLRVAQVSGISPFTVLHAADRDDIADLLRSLFAEQAVTLTPEEHRMVAALRRLTARGRRQVRAFMDALGLAESAPP